jgi:hypothetical protein
MFALLFALLALAAGPSVSMTVTQQPGVQNIHLRYTVTGPYKGRVCVDVDTPEDTHAAAFCADGDVDVADGKSEVVDEALHGPAGDWKMMPVLPDTPGDEPAVTGDSVRVKVAPSKAA